MCDPKKTITDGFSAARKRIGSIVDKLADRSLSEEELAMWNDKLRELNKIIESLREIPPKLNGG